LLCTALNFISAVTLKESTVFLSIEQLPEVWGAEVGYGWKKISVSLLAILISATFRFVMASYKHLMLIDDDEDDRDFFLHAMEEVLPDMVCEMASNGRIALDKLNSTPLRPDLIFLDLNMPLMNGRQFLEEIRNTHLAEIPVVILSTSGDAQTIRETIAMGARHFITKPDLLPSWERVLKGFFEDIEKILRK
jgi:CheY-like chemotaxis protein